MDALRKLSAEMGRSIADVIREAVDVYLEHYRGTPRAVLVERAAAVAGKFASGSGDVSSDHDQYVAEAFHH